MPKYQTLQNSRLHSNCCTKHFSSCMLHFEVPLSRMLHDILDDDHIQWHPPLIGHYTNFWSLLIWTLLLNLTFYLIVQGFHRTYATGAACQQRTLTPPDAWSCPTLGLACVLMLRPFSPELVLFPDFLSFEHPSVLLFCFLSKYLGSFCFSRTPSLWWSVSSPDPHSIMGWLHLVLKYVK